MTGRAAAFSGFSLLVAVLVLAACSGDAPPSGGVTATEGVRDQVSIAGNVPLQLSLELKSDSVRVGDAALVTVRLTNTSSQPVTAVRPFSPQAIVSFQITDQAGDRPLFNGPYVRLGPLSQARFVELEPGAAAEEQFDLAELYQLAPGEYVVRATYHNVDSGAHHGLDALTVERAAALVSDAVTLRVR